MLMNEVELHLYLVHRPSDKLLQQMFQFHHFHLIQRCRYLIVHRQFQVMKRLLDLQILLLHQ